MVMSIHQPRMEIFRMMTQIVFLTNEGRVAYCGPTRGLASYLVSALKLSSSSMGSNPADELLDAMGARSADVLVDCFNKSNEATRQGRVLTMLESLPSVVSSSSQDKQGLQASMARLVDVRGKQRSNWLGQVYHLSGRAARNTLRNPLQFLLHGVTALVASLVLGSVFHDIHSKDETTAGTQDRFGIMFFLVLYLSLLSLTSLPLWREEQLLFMAERGSGIYSTSAYVLTSMVFEVLPYRLLPQQTMGIDLSMCLCR